MREGRPSFNALQNYGTAPGPVVFYVFDVVVLAGGICRARRSKTGASCSRRKCYPN